jgi:hypothetical protein
MCQRSLLGQSLLETFLHHLVNSLHMHLPSHWSEPSLFCASEKHPMLVLLLLLLYIGIASITLWVPLACLSDSLELFCTVLFH